MSLDSTKKWEYSFFPVEFSDPFWDEKEPAAPNVYLRTGTAGNLYLNERGSEGWELVAIVPTKPIAGIPAQYQQVGDAEYPELKWNTYFGLFKREVHAR